MGKSVGTKTVSALEALSLAELKARLQQCLDQTLESMVEAANVVQVMYRKKGRALVVKLVEPGWLHVLELVGAGKIIPELALYCMDKATLIDRVAKCPEAQQRRLLKDPEVTLWFLAPKDTAWQHKRLAFYKLSVCDMQQVFDDGNGMRSDDASKAWYLKRRDAMDRREKMLGQQAYVVDADRHQIRALRRCTIGEKSLIAALVKMVTLKNADLFLTAYTKVTGCQVTVIPKVAKSKVATAPKSKPAATSAPAPAATTPA